MALARSPFLLLVSLPVQSLETRASFQITSKAADENGSSTSVLILVVTKTSLSEVRQPIALRSFRWTNSHCPRPSSSKITWAVPLHLANTHIHSYPIPSPLLLPAQPAGCLLWFMKKIKWTVLMQRLENRKHEALNHQWQEEIYPLSLTHTHPTSFSERMTHRNLTVVH